MPSSRFCKTCLALGVSGLILVAGLIAANTSWTGMSDPGAESLFRRVVLDPIPASIGDLKLKFQGGMDWQAVFHFSVAPADLDAILAARPYDLVDSDDLGAEQFARDVYPRFIVRGWPHPRRISAPEIYSCHISAETSIFYLMTNADHSEVFLLILNY